MTAPVAAGQWRRAPDGVPWYVASVSDTLRVLLLATDAQDAAGEWLASGGQNWPVKLVAAWPLCDAPETRRVA